eukprot:scaffold1272_cov250-Pinguiococcus_pyrenoidosus.AAC.21
MVEGLHRAHAALDVAVQQPTDELGGQAALVALAVLEELSRVLHAVVHDGVAHLPLAAAVEGRRAREEHVGDHAHGPHVAVVVVVAAEHLGRHVVRRAAAQLELRVVVEVLAEAEVDQLHHHVAGALDEPVLQLEVAVHDAALVKVPHGRQHLAQDVRALALAHVLSGLLHEVVEELSTGAQVHDEMQLQVAAVVDLPQAHDVRVVHLLQDAHLLVQLADLLGCHLPRLHGLHGVPGTGDQVPGLAHAAEGALAEQARAVAEVDLELALDGGVQRRQRRAAAAGQRRLGVSVLGDDVLVEVAVAPRAPPGVATLGLVGVGQLAAGQRAQHLEVHEGRVELVAALAQLARLDALLRRRQRPLGQLHQRRGAAPVQLVRNRRPQAAAVTVTVALTLARLLLRRLDVSAEHHGVRRRRRRRVGERRRGLHGQGSAGAVGARTDFHARGLLHLLHGAAAGVGAPAARREGLGSALQLLGRQLRLVVAVGELRGALGGVLDRQGGRQLPVLLLPLRRRRSEK